MGSTRVPALMDEGTGMTCHEAKIGRARRKSRAGRMKFIVLSGINRPEYWQARVARAKLLRVTQTAYERRFVFCRYTN